MAAVNPDLSELAATLERGTLIRSIPVAGGIVEIAGDGFTPGETVTAGIVSHRPKALGTTTAGATGRAEITVTIDADENGPATLILHGSTSGHGLAQDITIGTALPSTGGADPATNLLVLTAAVGGILALVARRRV